MSRPLKDSDLRKWEYRFHIFVKHELFRKYFLVWSKILGNVFGNIGYLDGFAGRGRYLESGKYGSPILALQALTENEKSFNSCLCVFIEKDRENYQSLSKVIEKKKSGFSSKIIIKTYEEEFSEIFPKYLDSMDKRPFFVFLDPFGFKGLPMTIVKEILAQDKNEIFITLMTRDINRFLGSEDHKKALTELLGSKENLIGIKNQDDVARRYVAMLSDVSQYINDYKVGADEKNENIYYLIHACNHFKGYKIMKDIMFNQGRKGEFAFRGIRDLRTDSLLNHIDPDRGKKFMKNFLLEKFKNKTLSYDKVLEDSYEEVDYIETQYREALKELEKEGEITIDRPGVKRHRGGLRGDYIIRFSPEKQKPSTMKRNELLDFFETKPEPDVTEGMELNKALTIGEEIKSLISDSCKKIEFAGSIRRRKPFVKDIEVVCEVKSSLEGKFNRILNDLEIQKRIKIIKDGARYKQLSFLDAKREELIKVDLFIVRSPAQWGIIYLLRTGSSAFSKRFVTDIKPNFRVNKGRLEKLRDIKDELGERKAYYPVRTPTERSVFEAVGWNYIEPEKRVQ